jgi:nitroreductase
VQKEATTLDFEESMMEEGGKRSDADIVWEAIYNRRSVRKFTDEPVSEEDIRRICEAGRWAPSGENSQGWRFIIIRDRNVIERLGKIAGNGSARRFTGELFSRRMHGRFETLQDEEKKKAAFEKLRTGDVSRFVTRAPVVIAVAGKKDVWDVQFDNAAAMENMLIMVSALGLGACWVVAPVTDIRDELEVNEILAIPGDYKAISLIPIGHMERLPRPRPRLALKEIMFADQFGKPYFKE